MDDIFEELVMSKKLPHSRVLQELLETAADLSAYGVVSKTDVWGMNNSLSAAQGAGTPLLFARHPIVIAIHFNAGAVFQKERGLLARAHL